ncbi:putative carbon monoxide dehydrogenase accessory protein [Gottschalkia acidurici 9a]|uniref:Carbon monoxide dehydrogenase accessory protein n=1 Tax=Gottschalkia acidurici (strain ATCC 7906 / DSM 604 / BCRC 14475 / CIP 104303 / KCTC 5404 / NCIMB 10678 / 9a) TaxID=1128398 RepID=K0AW92_GOTA9|nr:ATP-binding protein [Gottschalkia acidurici]AFS77489.1 putative carbon monoxide dehydrogenase accessory protein [Gottschalkia acidurici 9a]
MNIGVLSGKGGTGKTLISTNLALAMSGNYIDCDVEEPNGFIFLNPTNIDSKDVLVDYPTVDSTKCTLCGQCVSICEFNALAKSKKIFIFETLCHSCGACEMICPTNALKYEKRRIGKIDEGKYKDIKCIQGTLNIGEAMAVPVVKELLRNLPDKLNIIDCSPGTSCNVVTSLEYIDKAILVTESTEFGLHDLKRAVELCKKLNVSYGVVINRSTDDKTLIHQYCEDENIKILSTIPYSKEIAEIYSKGELLVETDKYKDIFINLGEKLRGWV